MQPLADTVIMPLFRPHVGCCTTLQLASTPLTGVSVTEQVPVQPLASVTVTVYVPPPSPVTVCVVSLVLQTKV